MNWAKDMYALVPKLRAHAWALTRGACDADDLVQETLMRAWQFRHTFRPGTNLKAWMFRILRNAHLASVSGKLRTVQDVDEIFTRRLWREADQEWRLRFDELLTGLAKLPASYQEALLLVAGSGLTYEEAAQVCAGSTGTMKSRVSRAREQLANLVDPDLSATAPRPQGLARAFA